MNAKQATRRGVRPARPECLCMGLGPELAEFLRKIGLSEPVRQHLRSARVEILKAARAMIEERIASLSREPKRGVAVKIE